MYGVIGGIRPLAPGFKKILFAPEPGGGLTSAECRLDTPQGRVECRWILRGKTLRGEVTVPARTTGELRIPGQRARKLAPGFHRFAGGLRSNS
jgi:alpha-L-rhamnosidase